ncbi:MAG: peptidoglycan bridge formation glycyltransferase FemA/FemB family protein [Candidatus Woykebacteria bacterium]
MIISRSLDREEWSKFINNHNEANIFQTPEMYEVYKKTLKYEPIFIAVLDSRKKNILGILLAVIQKEHKGILGKFSERSIIWGGPLIKNNDTKVLDYILKEYNKIINSKAIYTQFRNIWDWSDVNKNIFMNNGFDMEGHLDILHNLRIEPEDILKNMSSSRRKNIRRAIREPLKFIEVNNDKEINICIDLIEQTYKEVGLPSPDRQYFLNAHSTFKPTKYLKIFAAKYDDEIIACRFVLCFEDLIYDWYAGANSKFLKKYPNDFLPFKIMEWGAINGYKTFDFGGAGKPNVPYGVRDYKLKFGGELVEFGRFEKVHNSLLMKVGELGIAAYRKLK